MFFFSCASLDSFKSNPTADNPSFIPSNITFVIKSQYNEIAFVESSLPGIGYVTFEGSTFVSHIATTGIPNLFASFTAVAS